MTYFIYDSRGYVGDLATTSGLSDLIRALGTAGAYKQIFTEGFTEDIDPLILSLEDVSSPDPDLNRTIVNFRTLVKKCKDIIIISDGTESEEVVTKGGAGSGNFGHEGRPGERGGSGGGGGGGGLGRAAVIAEPRAAGGGGNKVERMTRANAGRKAVELKSGEHEDPEATRDKFKNLGKGKGRPAEFQSAEELATVLDSGKYAIVSAWRNPNNPDDKDTSDAELEMRHESLKSDLREKGYQFTETLGKYGSPEPSVMVFTHDPELKDVLQTGSKFGQDSVIYAEKGSQFMIYTSNSKTDEGSAIPKGSYIKGSGYENVSGEAEDFYTEVPIGSDEKARFSLNFEFGSIHGPKSSGDFTANRDTALIA